VHISQWHAWDGPDRTDIFTGDAIVYLAGAGRERAGDGGDGGRVEDDRLVRADTGTVRVQADRLAGLDTQPGRDLHIGQPGDLDPVPR
jgi:hypothetical protein